MTRDDVIRMAREAGLCTWTIPPDERVAEWARFAALVAAAEREACAVACEQSDRFRGAYFAEKIRTWGQA